jgi:hypothetical protein
MPIVQQGSINTTALIVPDLYVQIVPPQNIVINGVPTNIVGVVGTAQWGPVNKVAVIGSMAQYSQNFGAIQNRAYDMGTQVATAVQQGASNFRCVRVTDGTDTQASVTVQTTGITFKAAYTGTLGNSVTITLAAGSLGTGYVKLTVGLAGFQPEIYDNIPYPTTGTVSVWQNIVTAVTLGMGQFTGASNNPLRGPSLLITASNASSSTSLAPTLTSYTLSGGTDGVTSVADATLLGTNASYPLTGMYALSGQGCGIIVIPDMSGTTTWSAQQAFGLAQGAYMILAAPAGTGVNDGGAATITMAQTAGLAATYATKLMNGDWLYWLDQVNNVVRLVSPQGFIAGRLANLSPEQSSLNKPIYGILGSQKSGLNTTGTAQTYSAAELGNLIANGIDVICNPAPGGAYWAARSGHNTSLNAAINGDVYTRLTNYIASTLNAGMGLYVGAVINIELFNQIRATLLSFLQALLSQRILGTTDGKLPFSVVCDISNNPNSRTGIGYVQADVQIKYQGINEKFIVNVEGGATVNVNRQTLPSGQQ